MAKSLTIFGLAGSLRQGSFNKAALRAAKELAPKNVTIHIFERLGEIPPFNQDQESTPPEVVADLKKKIRAADAILFVTPEYNYSIPGVLKNAIDWASRPYGDSAWEGKPVAVMGAAGSMLGTARAQYHLRQCFIFLNMYPLNRPEVMIASAHEKFDEKGNLTDIQTKEKIKELIEALSSWAVNVQKMNK